MSYADQNPEQCVSEVAVALRKKQKDVRTTRDTKMQMSVGHLEGVMREISHLNCMVDSLRAQLKASSTNITGNKFVKQDKFSPDALQPDTGNCFQVCIATVLGKHVHEVPHFYSLYSGMDATVAIANFLGAHGYQIAHYPTEVMLDGLKSGWFYHDSPDEVVVIVTGDSPRGDFKHAVVGVLDLTEPNGWRLLHDPHPSNAGITSTDFFELISKTVRVQE